MSDGISRETFDKADTDTKLGIIFDQNKDLKSTLESSKVEHKAHKVGCDTRFSKLEKRKKIDTGLASGAGLVGGFIASLFKDLIGK